MTGDFPAELRSSFFAGLGRDLVKAELPEGRPGRLDFLQTHPSLFLALGFDRRVVIQISLEKGCRFADSQRINSAPRLLLYF
jgi:hypothetical protein